MTLKIPIGVAQFQVAPRKLVARAGIWMDTFIDWRRKDPRAVADCAMRRLQGIEKHGKENFAALCWLIERRHPELFGCPGVQLDLIQQNTTVENSLSINITSYESAEIEREAAPIRKRVAAMFESYRPQPLGNGEKVVHEVEATPVLEQQLSPSAEQTLITHRADDEKS